MFKSLKNKLLVGLMAIASLFGYQYNREPIIEVAPIAVENSVPTKPIPTDNGIPQMELGEVKNATDEDFLMIKQGIVYANRVLASECFRNKVLEAKFTETNGLTNSQIYDVLASKKIKIGATMFYGTRMQNYIYKTVGLDNGSGVVFANSFYVNSPEIFGSLAIHEAEGHGQGFHHYNVKATSVPYQFNNFFDDCFTK